MITLVLVRHAKSDQGVPGPDHERPLNDRGMRDAPVMAQRLAATGFRPEVIRSSDAVRARTTAEAFGAALDTGVDLDPDLYGAPADTILQAAVDTGAAAVVVVAHDPGMSDLAAQLSEGGIEQMPTCAVATFVWDADEWDAATGARPTSWTLDTPKA